MNTPPGWKSIPLKFICERSALYGANEPAESYSVEGIRFIRTTDIREDGTLEPGGVFLPEEAVRDYMLEHGDFLISRSGTIGRAFVYEEKYGPCAYAGYLVRFVFKKGHNPRYFFYLTKSTDFQSWLSMSAIEATIGNVSGDKYANLRVPTPTKHDQDRIVAYLDRETSRIDALIAAKERLLELLAEKRRALITQAVTKGLNPNAPMRDSGLPWLGEVPRHWETERAKWLFKERDERTESDEGELLTVSHITGVTPRSEKEVFMFEAETTEGYKKCRIGDLVINTLWAWMGAMGVSPLDGIVSPAYNVYIPNNRLLPSYVNAIARMPLFATEVTRFSKGVWSSRLRLYPEGLFEVCLPVPPTDEQEAIVGYIKENLDRIEALARSTENTVALLRERRSALIAAAVTGKIDVSMAA